MKTAVALLSLPCLLWVSSGLPAGDRFFQSHRERTRSSVPNYAYRAGKSPAVSAVVSESTIILFDPNSGAPPSLKVEEQGRAFVFNDLVAGPLVLTSLGAKTDGNGCIVLTGIINHTGGDTGQLLGGKAVLRVEPLTNTGTTVANSTILAAKEASCWVRRNEPEAVQICLPHTSGWQDRFGQVERVRVFLEYHPNR